MAGNLRGRQSAISGEPLGGRGWRKFGWLPFEKFWLCAIGLGLVVLAAFSWTHELPIQLPEIAAAVPLCAGLLAIATW